VEGHRGKGKREREGREMKGKGRRGDMEGGEEEGREVGTGPPIGYGRPWSKITVTRPHKAQAANAP